MNTDPRIPRSPASRVSIDGNRIKYLRETKGLTQLYIATFLGVTADTVSRWENRRYPTVKWENVEKLAEALEVDVSEILDQGHEEPEKEIPEEEGEIRPPVKSRNMYFLVAGLLLAVMSLAAVLVFYPRQEAVTITATRFLPRHVPAGQPFPVIVRVDSSSEQPFSFILQEALPENFGIIKGLPSIVSHDPVTNTVKWISNSQQSPFYLAYLVRAARGDSSKKIRFSGRIKADNAPLFQQEVSGDSVLEISNYHWIDSNSDGVIDDEEILTVYGSADVLKGLGVDMEEIKMIWSAGKYSWNPADNTYQILQSKRGE